MSWFFNAMLSAFGRYMPWDFPLPELQPRTLRQGHAPSGVRAAKRAAAKRRNRLHAKRRPACKR